MKRGIKDPTTGITEGKMRTLLKSNLRPIWRQTARKIFIASVRYHATNPATGRTWYVVDCKDCNRVMGVGEKERRPLAKGGLSKKTRSVFEVDHVNGITPLTDIRLTLGEHFHDMIYGKHEVVCYKCHKARSTIQTKERNLKIKLATTTNNTKIINMKTIRELLKEEFKIEGEISERELACLLMFETKEVKSGATDNHRWYSLEDVVVKVAGEFVDTYRVHADGDNCWSDCVEPKSILDDAKIVQEKTRTITETYYD